MFEQNSDMADHAWTESLVSCVENMQWWEGIQENQLVGYYCRLEVGLAPSFIYIFLQGMY